MTNSVHVLRRLVEDAKNEEAERERGKAWVQPWPPTPPPPPPHLAPLASALSTVAFQLP